MRETSLADGQEITLRRDPAGPGGVSTRLSCKEGSPSPDAIPFRSSVWLSDGGALSAFKKSKHVSAKNARYLQSATLQLGSMAPSEGSRQSGNRSQSDIDENGIISLTRNGQGYEGYRVYGSIHADIVGATKIQRGSEKALTEFEGDAWKDIRLDLGESIYVEGTDVVDWQRRQRELMSVDESGHAKKMVEDLLKCHDPDL
jgi:hypothetical protein